MEEAEVIRLCQKGDSQSFEELYRLYVSKALGMAYMISGKKDVAEDIVQEAFAACFKEIGKLRNPGVFRIWFYRLLVRIGWRMAAKKRNNVSTSDITELADDASPRMEDVIYLNDERYLVRKAVNNLPFHYKTAIVLYYFNELSVKEISDILGCFQGTVKSRLHNGRKLLQKELTGVLDEEDSSAFYRKGEEING